MIGNFMLIGFLDVKSYDFSKIGITIYESDVVK